MKSYLHVKLFKRFAYEISSFLFYFYRFAYFTLEPTRRWTAFADVRRLPIYHIENTSSRLFESTILDEAALFNEVKETVWKAILSECHDLNSLSDSIHAIACRASIILASECSAYF